MQPFSRRWSAFVYGRLVRIQTVSHRLGPVLFSKIQHPCWWWTHEAEREKAELSLRVSGHWSLVLALFMFWPSDHHQVNVLMMKVSGLNMVNKDRTSDQRGKRLLGFFIVRVFCSGEPVLNTFVFKNLNKNNCFPN